MGALGSTILIDLAFTRTEKSGAVKMNFLRPADGLRFSATANSVIIKENAVRFSGKVGAPPGFPAGGSFQGTLEGSCPSSPPSFDVAGRVARQGNAVPISQVTVAITNDASTLRRRR